MSELYDGRTAESWYDELQPQEEWMARHFLVAIGLLGFPKTFLDIGCGFGVLIETAKSLKIPAHGIDQLVPPYDNEYNWGQELHTSQPSGLFQV